MVYFAGLGPFVKIGTSENVAKRIRELSKPGEPTRIPGLPPGPVRLLATMPGDRERERQLHVRFDHCNVDGEWFLPDREMDLLIQRLQRRTEEAA